MTRAVRARARRPLALAGVMALVAFVLFAPVPLGREDVAQAATPELTITYAGTTVGLELRATAHLRMTANATGTIRFDLYGPNDDFCATSIFTSTVAVVPGQEAYQSDPFTTSRGGDYRWTATYSGDPNNTAVATPCGGPVRVSREGTSIATDASGEVALGGSISDTAHLTRGFHPTGSITFSLFGPLDVFCEGQPVFQSTVTVDHGAGDYVSGSTEPLLPGTYRWMAAYTGDENNLASGPGSCSDPREDVLVVPLVSTTSSTTTSSSIPGSTTSSTAPTSSTTTSTTPGGSTTTTTTPGGSTTSSTAPTSSTTTSTTPGGSTTTTTTPGGSTSTTSSTAPTSSTTLPGGSTTTTTPGGSTTTTTTPGGSTTTTTPGGSTTTTTTPGGSTTTTSSIPSSTTTTSTVPSSTTTTSTVPPSTTTTSTTPVTSTTTSTAPATSTSTSTSTTTTTVAPTSTSTTAAPGIGATGSTPTTGATATAAASTVPAAPTTTSTTIRRVPSITASPNPATAGQDVLVAGSGFPGGTPVDVIVQSDPVLLGTVVADAAGAFRASFRIPADTPPGNHRLVAQARVGGVQADVVVVVVAPAVVTTTIRPTTGQTLSRTGANVEGPARLAGALVGIGFGLVGLTWRSKRTRRPLRV